MTVFGWLISLFDKSANLVRRALRIEPVHDLDISASATDLQHIIADSRDSGDLSAELSIMIDRVLDFPQRDVEHAMVPRSQVDWVSPDTTLDELRTLMARAHTRYPVVDDDDAPVGVVHLSDILTRLGEGQIDETVGSVMRPATVIPTLMPLPDALEHLVTTTNQLACVIDEFGGFAGVLTIEDLAMEIVGEITDEHDIENGAALVSEGDNIWIMEGDVHLDEVERAIGHDLPRGDFETVAGLLIAEAGALPSEGDTVIVDLPVDPSELVADEPELRRLEVDVLRVERHVPAEVRVRLVEMSAAESVR
jgi:CBS domain containing-hemolysin-like protein